MRNPRKGKRFPPAGVEMEHWQSSEQPWKDVPALGRDRILLLGLSVAQWQEQETCDLRGLFTSTSLSHLLPHPR
ncbi:hypothetical protein DV515_00013422 [Chloebia gouldiae]|uniref:Uncharacterized protein n=1 Tax=Chloebia gouldiae TaxID=44316 RepID=A0A3L8S0T5_CHLGU|nr:hypothetical protein DV515_00013422 [Chloebia gouldiae]